MLLQKDWFSIYVTEARRTKTFQNKVSKIVLCAAVAGFIVDVAIAIENFADLKTSPNFAVFWKIFIGYFFVTICGNSSFAKNYLKVLERNRVKKFRCLREIVGESRFVER
jgi:hypothetical protein